MDRRLTLATGEIAVGSPEPAAWERLVTDGHVRAARWRWIQPWLIALGVALILTGAYAQYGIRFPQAANDRRARLAAAVAEIRNPASRILGRMPGIPNVPADKLGSLLPYAQLEQTADAILTSLDQS